jgi:hypothetical protein
MTDTIIEAISPITIGGAGYGNTYQFQVTRDGMTVLVSCVRDLAWYFERDGIPVPAEFQGPYDCYGHKIDQQAGE